MKYNDLFKNSLDKTLLDKDTIFNSIIDKIHYEELREKISLTILFLLYKKDNCGFNLIKELNLILKEDLDNKEGLIYPVLHYLEINNYITSYWIKDEIDRKYYNISKLGKKFIKNKEFDSEILKDYNISSYKEHFSWN